MTHRAAQIDLDAFIHAKITWHISRNDLIQGTHILSINHHVYTKRTTIVTLQGRFHHINNMLTNLQ